MVSSNKSESVQVVTEFGVFRPLNRQVTDFSFSKCESSKFCKQTEINGHKIEREMGKKISQIEAIFGRSALPFENELQNPIEL